MIISDIVEIIEKAPYLLKDQKDRLIAEFSEDPEAERIDREEDYAGAIKEYLYKQLGVMEGNLTGEENMTISQIAKEFAK